MSTDNEKLYLVFNLWSTAQKTKVFRTRAAARKYAKDRTAATRGMNKFVVRAASWGPEQ